MISGPALVGGAEVDRAVPERTQLVPSTPDTLLAEVLSHTLSAVVICRQEDPGDPSSFRVTFMNAATETVVHEGIRELVGRPLLEVFPHVDQTRFAELAHAVVSNHAAQRTSDFPYEVPGRGQRIYQLELIPVQRDTVLVMAQDITDLREAQHAVEEQARELSRKNAQLEATIKELRETQEQLLHAEKMTAVGALAAGIAHEVNSPIGALQSSVDVARRAASRLRDTAPKEANWSASPRARRLLAAVESSSQSALEASQRIAQLVRRISQLTEPPGAAQQRTDLMVLLRQAAGKVTREREESASIVVQGGPLPPLLCYPEEIGRLFYILLQNASEHSPPEGVVRVEASASERFIRLTIADDGHGMSDEEVRSLRDPGFSSDGSRVRLRLGLQIAQTIVFRHGGRLDISSTPGAGTRVQVQFELA